MKPIRVVLVDDERLTLELMQKCINWEQFNMEICATFLSAEEAIAKIGSICPDIIVSDINMPRIDGISFGKIVRSQYPQIHFLLLTGYEEFTYVKESIRMGAADYLLKPINPEEISATMKRLYEKIKSEREKKEYFEGLQKRVSTYVQYYRELMFQKMLIGDLEEKELETVCAEKKISLKAPFRLCLICAAELSEQKKLHSRVEKLFLNEPFYYVFPDVEGNTAVFAYGAAVQNLKISVQAFLEKREQEGKKTMITVSKILNSFSEISEEYRCLLHRLQFMQLFGSTEEDIEQKAEKQKSCLEEEQIRRLSTAVRCGNKDEIRTLVEANVDRISRSVRDMHSVHAEIIIMFFQVAQEFNGIEALSLFPTLLSCISDNPLKASSYEFCVQVSSCFEKLSEEVNNIQTKRVSTIVEEVVNYIEQNYADYELSLKSIAEAFYRNPSYLSRIFKQEVGESLIEYITHVRMKAAEKLLRDTDLKFYTIAERVGILDANYFTICFRKYFGISPSQYRLGQKN